MSIAEKSEEYLPAEWSEAKFFHDQAGGIGLIFDLQSGDRVCLRLDHQPMEELIRGLTLFLNVDPEFCKECVSQMRRRTRREKCLSLALACCCLAMALLHGLGY